MALFGRSAHKERLERGEVPVAGSEVDDVASGASLDEPAPGQSGAAVRGSSVGPWDLSEAPEIGAKIDLGSIWMPGIQDMTLRMEVDNTTKVITGVAIVSEGSALQVQAFAAPRSEGIWDEIRAEIAESLTDQGAVVDDIVGVFGRELLAQVPAEDPEGQKVRRLVRFIGVDGPRWFLRGVITGKAAGDGAAAKPIEDLFGNITVLRDQSPRAPRDVLVMTPPQSGPVRPTSVQGPGTGRPNLNPFARGPEITEIR